MNDYKRRIYVYVDSSVLTPGKSNPVTAAAWAAVIMEQNPYLVSTRYITGDATEHAPNSTLVESMGVYEALQSIKATEWQFEPRPEIVLYTDQKDFISYVSAYQRDNLENGRNSNSIHAKTAKLLTELGATIHYEKDPGKIDRHPPEKLHPLSVADHMARARAHAIRLEMQGFIHYHGTGILKGEEAQAYISTLTPVPESLSPGKGFTHTINRPVTQNERNRL